MQCYIRPFPHEAAHQFRYWDRAQMMSYDSRFEQASEPTASRRHRD